MNFRKIVIISFLCATTSGCSYCADPKKETKDTGTQTIISIDPECPYTFEEINEALNERLRQLEAEEQGNDAPEENTEEKED